MSNRVFIGLPISSHLQEEIDEWRKQYTNLPVKWLRGKNIHVTLLPPWYSEDIDKEKEILKSFKGMGRFSLSFQQVEYGPPWQAHLIWATGAVPGELTKLKESLVHAYGHKEEGVNPFLLHLTLARFRKEQFSSFPIQKFHEKISWETQVTSLILFNSHLSSTGADYTCLEEVLL